jgi:hypothetical protein
MELLNAPKAGGFDIVLANPPYVRQELLGDYKNFLKPIYPEVHNGLADLYVYFYARAHQLLRNGGVSCFISSNKWLRAGYGEKLRQHLLDSQAFKLVVDFGELPVFQTAATFPAIFLWQKQPRKSISTNWAVIKNLQECYNEGIFEHVSRIANVLPSDQFGKNKPRLTNSTKATLREQMDRVGIPMGDFVSGQFFRGVVSGFNEAFMIDAKTKERLIKEDKKSKELLKPLVRGDDVRRFEIHYRGSYYIFVEWQCQIEKFTAIYDYLKGFKKGLASRPEVKEGRFPWYAMSRYGAEFAHLYERPKILYPEIGKEARFTFDDAGYYGADTTHFVAKNDWYLLGVLNSSFVFEYLKITCSILGDEDKAGRLRFKPIYMERLPIPNAPQKERDAVAKLVMQAHNLHTQRRRCVEKFLREIVIDSAESTSRNPLESPWLLSEEDFTRRSGRDYVRVYKSAREETMSLTEEIVKVEKEIDERVKNLYGL